MDRNPLPADEELDRRTDEVLHDLWDPIGVAGIPGARDEYAAYLPQVVSLLKRDAGTEAIAEYLCEVTTQPIGLGGRRDRDRQIADLLLAWNADFSPEHGAQERHGGPSARGVDLTNLTVDSHGNPPNRR